LFEPHEVPAGKAAGHRPTLDFRGSSRPDGILLVAAAGLAYIAGMPDKAPASSFTRRHVLAGAAAAAALALVPGLQAQGKPTLKAQRLSWAGVRLEAGDTTLLLDPLLDPKSLGVRWALPPVPVVVNMPRRLGLITNLLNDHFDVNAMRTLLGPRGRVLCPHEIAPQVAGEGLRPWPMRLWEPALFGAGEGAVTVTAVPTSDGFGEDGVMWVVRAGARKVLHGGDVMWHAHWWRIGAALGPFDMAFLPINGAVVQGRPPHVDAPRTLTPEQAVAACVALGARALCPIHYGLDDPPSYAETPDALPRTLRAGASRGIGVVAAAEGQWLDFPAGS